MKCDIIIPVWNQQNHTRSCVEHIAKNTRYPYRLIIIDNGSDAPTRDYLKTLALPGVEVTIVRNEANLGFVKAVNQGLKLASAPYICIMNNDTVAAPGWLERLVEFSEAHPDIGLLNPVSDGHLDTPIDTYAKALEANRGVYMEMNQCFGFCMLMKRAVFEKVGLLDEAFGIGGYDDTDYSMRAHRAGFRCACVHSSYVYHRQHVTFSAMGDRKKLVSPGEKAYFEKWPRHLRIGAAVSMSSATSDAEIGSLLKLVLYLAREWCWVNLWIFGQADDNRARVAAVSRKIQMPLHQNIKFTYMPAAYLQIQLAVRLIERAFGTKRRKRYDAVLVDENTGAQILRMLAPLHGTKIHEIRLSDDNATMIESIMTEARKR